MCFSEAKNGEKKKLDVPNICDMAPTKGTFLSRWTWGLCLHGLREITLF